MNKNMVAAISLGLVCLILTIAICIQIKTVNSTNSTVAQTFVENDLRDQVLKMKEKYDNETRNLTSAEKELDKVRENATANNEDSVTKEKQISQNNKLLGKTNLVGTGIEIIVRDNTNVTEENIGIASSLEDYIIHDGDIRSIVNELINAGAEAVSVNGQRIVNSTAIICVGTVIKINNEKVNSPFIIKAIGSPESLIALDRLGGYVNSLRSYGLIESVKKSNKVEIPKFTGAITSKYINITK